VKEEEFLKIASEKTWDKIYSLTRGEFGTFFSYVCEQKIKEILSEDWTFAHNENMRAEKELYRILVKHRPEYLI